MIKTNEISNFPLP